MEFSLATIIISIFVLIGIGFLIGSIGVGGVYLVPFLVYYHEIDISLAISVAMFSFMFTGISGFITYFKKINFNWNNNMSVFDEGLTDSQIMMREVCRKFVDNTIEPFIRLNWQDEWKMVPDNRLPANILEEADRIGIRTLAVPEKFGGTPLEK